MRNVAHVFDVFKTDNTEGPWRRIKLHGVGHQSIVTFLNGSPSRAKRGYQCDSNMAWNAKVIEQALNILDLPDDTDIPDEEVVEIKITKSKKANTTKNESSNQKKLRETKEKRMSGAISRKAVTSFPKMTQATSFIKSIGKYPIPREKQIKLAKKLSEEGSGAKQIAKAVKKAAGRKNINKWELMEDDFNSIITSTKLLTTKMNKFVKACHDNKLTKLSGDAVKIGYMEIWHLANAMKAMKELDATPTNVKTKKDDALPILEGEVL